MKSLSTRSDLPLSVLARSGGAILSLISAAFLLLLAGAPLAQAGNVIRHTFPVGIDPVGLTFDGTNIWVVSQYDSAITKLRASDGANQGTFTVGRHPEYAAFDGENIWVSSYAGESVTKVTRKR